MNKERKRLRDPNNCIYSRDRTAVARQTLRGAFDNDYIAKAIETAYRNGAKTIVIPAKDDSSPEIRLPIDLNFKRVVLKTRSGRIVAVYDTATLIKAGLLKVR